MSQEEVKGLDVKYAVLHTGIYIPSAGTVGPTLTLDATNSKVTKMTIRGEFLVITAKEPSGSPVKDKTLVPLTNVTHFIPA
jgi:hypothetical protein